MARVRMTQRNAGHENNREAASAPASYGWEPDHPAHKADPEVDDYLIDNDGNGTGSEPSDFNEDVHAGPYENGAHPATPDEGPYHPAQPAGKQAAMRRRAAEKKAAKCIRIAQAMLGETATVAQIEDQAVDLMDLSDASIDRQLERLSTIGVNADQNDPEDKTLNPGGTVDGEPAIEADPEEVEEESKKAADFLAEEDLAAEELLAAMLAEEEADEEAGDEEAYGDVMSEMPMMAEMPVMGEMPMMAEHHDEASDEIADLMAPEAGDPMGLMDEGPSEDDAILAELFAGRLASDEEGEDEEGEDEEAEDEDEEAGKKASDDEAEDEEAEDEEAEDEDEEAGKKAASKQRPKARKSSKGARSLGAVTKAASSEINDLSQLWETAPDVTDVFGN